MSTVAFPIMAGRTRQEGDAHWIDCCGTGAVVKERVRPRHTLICHINNCAETCRTQVDGSTHPFTHLSTHQPTTNRSPA